MVFLNTIMDIIGFIAAFIIGIVLGLIGSGGSILTLPVLVYIMGIEPVHGTAYSLFIVGITAVAGGLEFTRKKLIDQRAVIIFAIPSLITVYLTRLFMVPALPDTLLTIQGEELTKGMGIMLLFAVLMLAASISMIRGNGIQEKQDDHKQHPVLIIFEGIIVGFLTGLVGAGGGFLIIPALVVFGKIPMKKAVGTSLLIIAFKSLIGFIGDVQNLEIDWPFLIYFSAFTVAGIYSGSFLSHYVSSHKLKPAFGWFILLMGFYIIVLEVLA